MKGPVCLLLWAVMTGTAFAQSSSNDHIFPPVTAAAGSFMNFDGKGFLINGKRVFLVSAGLEYARVPRALWHDRLLRLKRAGFNCVEVYTFWNYHEPAEGQFDFSGDHDLEAFLTMSAEMGLYVIARVGPYYCAEWDNGGYPLWLRFKPGVKVRQDDPAFLSCVDRFFDRLLPIIVRNQIHRGGPVILVQLENEHNDGWGTVGPNGYFRHLREKALSMGVEVPYFFSGLHHASDPAGEAPTLDDPARPNPWFSTEFWSVWYNGYGSTEKDARTYERRTWKIIAHGGGGYNYYMAYGGTNFGYTNNDEDAASYDYGAAVGQAGDLRPIYFTFKRAAWFARSFQDILCNATDGTAAFSGLVRDTACHVTARHSPAGDIVFLDNAGAAARTVKIGVGGPAFAGGAMPEAVVSLAPGEIFPIVKGFKVCEAITLAWAPVRILGIGGPVNDRTMVIYGETGDVAQLQFSVRGKAVITGDGARTVIGGKVVLTARFPKGLAPLVYTITAGGARVKVLVMNRAGADRTWFAGKEDSPVTGYDYIGDASAGGKSMVTERLQGKGVDGAAALGSWMVKDAGGAAVPDFDDHQWKASEWPLQMGADGDGSPNVWYRTTIQADTTGPYVLEVEGGDRAKVYVDGRLAAAGNIHDGEIPLSLSQGSHTLAVFTAHDGRDKLAGFVGDMSTADCKGLTGQPRLEPGTSASEELKGWKFLPAAAADSVRAPAKGTWSDYTIGQDAFGLRKGYGWFSGQLPEPPRGVTKANLQFRSVDENATVFINGRRMAKHDGWNMPFTVVLDRLDTMSRPILLTVFIENYSNEGGIDRPVRISYIKDLVGIRGWRMHGGIDEPAELSGWRPMDERADTSMPRYYRTVFTMPGYGAGGDHPIWRVHTTGMGHGSVWMNGHNLGRYPEKTPAPGLYIPECWLKAGENELVVYDEDGKSPGLVSVEREVAAGRWIDVAGAGAVPAVSGGGAGVPGLDPVGYVDPFIGTAKSDVYTKWGNEGGTYPGAVAPWGYIQLSPETKVGKGYDHDDSSICYFSCLGHPSGYPQGSAGRLRVMPVGKAALAAARGGVGLPGMKGAAAAASAGSEAAGAGLVDFARPFLHADEQASPGYYRVRFRDDGCMVEAAAAVRTGFFRFTWPAGAPVALYVGDMGTVLRRSSMMLAGSSVSAVLVFDRPFMSLDSVRGDGAIVRFAPAISGPTVIVLRVDVPAAGVRRSAAAGVAVKAADFDRIRKETRAEWRKNLSVVEIDDERSDLKKIFYTALYHTMLLPYVISDGAGSYRGADGLVHRAAGKNAYGSFSPWDTFRSLHPLLALLFPERQRDMVLSLMDPYKYGGRIPTGPMTGNHAIPIIVDSWMKGIRAGDSATVYRALRKGVADAPYIHADRDIYMREGFVPSGYPESVTRTVEYAYDDWCLSEFARKAAGRTMDIPALAAGADSYRALFDAEEMLLLPREGAHFHKRPGTSGYKEGDAWVYSYFVPQDPRALVALMGGDAVFAERLDGALRRGDIVFDNETVFQVPYLFNYSGRGGRTQRWVSAIRDGRFSSRPGGLPGNDDMGSMSAWYVFSALGLYPVCPGRPAYDIGTPLFRSVTLHLTGGATFRIKAPGVDETNKYVGRLKINGMGRDSLQVSHDVIMRGGTMEFVMRPSAAEAAAGAPGVGDRFSITGGSLIKPVVRPHEPFGVSFVLHNGGGMWGTKVVRVMSHGREAGSKNCLLGPGMTITDTVYGRLYASGRAMVGIDGSAERYEIEVTGGAAVGAVNDLMVEPVLKKGQEQFISYTVQNTGGERKMLEVPVRLDEQVVRTDSVTLDPGEKRVVKELLPVGPGRNGLHAAAVMGASEQFKVYEHGRESLLLDLSPGKDNIVRDRSGFGNDGRMITEAGKVPYTEVGHSLSLDRMGETITMMARVYPTAPGEMLMDIFTKGDNHVLQVAGNESLTFFAGGWGRGDCTVKLPADWLDHWHVIAGVCSGGELKVYIDGVLQGSAEAAGRVNLSVENKWVVGRNEEFPGQRVFQGTVGRVKVFAAALTAEEIFTESNNP